MTGLRNKGQTPTMGILHLPSLPWTFPGTSSPSRLLLQEEQGL